MGPVDIGEGQCAQTKEPKKERNKWGTKRAKARQEIARLRAFGKRQDF